MTDKKSSRIPGFGRLDMEQRLASLEEMGIWERGGEALSDALADRMVENCLGVFGMPLGVATNFLVDGEDVLLPMVTEEPSVIAAASNAARMVRAGGGFATTCDDSVTTAQVEILGADGDAPERIEGAAATLVGMADATQPELVRLGGGVRELQVRRDVGAGRLVVHLHVDCKDAMGANMVNTMAEAIAPRLEELSGGRTGLRILTNLADRRIAEARCAVPVSALARAEFSGDAVARGVEDAWRFAADDPYRAATHNKGIFNGIDALLIACGNDWRAVEAGGHAFAARDGSYAPLTTWSVNDGVLNGVLRMPMAVGVVGGAAKAHPVARRCLSLARVSTADKLARLAVAVGLASNLAALAALAGEGIQKGHMRLHERRL